MGFVGRPGMTWLIAGAMALSLASANAAEAVRYLRIGVGPAGESHFALGELIASAISNPPGGPSCELGGGCGVPGLIAAASATGGSVDNLKAIGAGHLDAALVRAEVCVWAANGTGPFAGHPVTNFRAVANLYPDEIQVVVRNDGIIRQPPDLIGKRVSLGAKGSGTLLWAKRLLAAWNIRDNQIDPVYLHAAAAADALAEGRLDAFFVIDGAPIPAVAALARTMPIRLLPVSGSAAAALRQSDTLMGPTRVPANTYTGIETPVDTVRLPLTLVVAADLDDDLVYGITKALWQPETAKLLADSRLKAVPLSSMAAASGLGAPLHPGATRYYTETGLIR
jgi:TRAP transporter TAXI family solute receptor